jgi:hypothetical protein
MNITRVIEPSKTDLPSLFTFAPRHTRPHRRSAVGTKLRPDILARLLHLQALDRPSVTTGGRQVLGASFSPVALGIFPNPVTSHYPVRLATAGKNSGPPDTQDFQR